MHDPEMPEPAEDVDLGDDSEDGGSEYGSGDGGDTLQDFIETLYHDFPFIRTENHPCADSRPTENQPEGPDSSRETRGLRHNSTGPNIEEIRAGKECEAPTQTQAQAALQDLRKILHLPQKKGPDTSIQSSTYLFTHG